ncbi:MAG: NADH:flavin oxidoreductase, partial [Alphaproteobacteria bacterium]|nr:NADH:flavin oxidoreductase [Alphaproteobacteria bacterium]
FITSPMTRISAQPDGVPSDLMKDYYAAYANGGFGLIITEGTYTDLRSSQGYFNQPGIASDRQVEGWKPIVEIVKNSGARFIQQLLHAGALAQGNTHADRTIAPSAVQPKGEQLPHYGGAGLYPTPTEMTLPDIAETVEAFAEAARRSVAAGFDGVEIHGANGYICDQFMTDYTNQRTDEYGGALENRLRFSSEVVRAVVDAVGGKAIVGIRISQMKVNDFTHQWQGGATDADTIFKTINEAGADYIHVSTRNVEPVFGTDIPLVGFAKKYARTVIANGGMNDPDQASNVIRDGHADFVSIAKGALADPSLPSKIATQTAPISFNPGMITPVATIQNTADWKAANL